jgi:hypothetical protein
LTFSTKAGGKVFSMPNKIPIFFISDSPVDVACNVSPFARYKDVASHVSTGH